MSTSDLPPEVIPAIHTQPNLGLPFETPIGTALAFLHALEDRAEFLVALLRLTTPESHEAWGDFSQAEAHLASVGPWSVGTGGQVDGDAAYIAVFRDTTGRSYLVTDDVQVAAAVVISLVRRPAHGGWLVHGMGHSIPPEGMPTD